MFAKPKEGVDMAAALVLVAVAEMYVGIPFEGVGELPRVSNQRSGGASWTHIARSRCGVLPVGRDLVVVVREGLNCASESVHEEQTLASARAPTGERDWARRAGVLMVVEVQV